MRGKREKDKKTPAGGLQKRGGPGRSAHGEKGKTIWEIREHEKEQGGCFGPARRCWRFAAAWSRLSVRHAAPKSFPDAIIRLHIVAASDSQADQADKLLVRDGIAELARLELSACQTRQEAEQVILSRLDEIEHKAAEILAQQGRPADVTARLAQEHFPCGNTEGSPCPPAPTLR